MRMNVRKRFLSMNLQRKVRMMFLYMMGICILFWFCIFYIVLETKMESTAIEKEKNNRVAITKNFDIALENLNSISHLIMLSEGVDEYLTVPSLTASVAKTASQDIYNIVNTFETTYSVTVLRWDGRYINTGVGVTRVDIKTLYTETWLKEIRERKGGYVLRNNRDRVFDSKTEKVMNFVRIINDIDTQEEKGIFAINIPEDFFKQTYVGLADRNNHFAFFDQSGYLLSSDDPSIFQEMKKKGEFQFGQTIKKKFFMETVTTLDRVPNTDLILVTYSEVDLLEGLSQRLTIGAIGGILILLFFMYQINAYIAKNVVMPIHKLVESMSEVQKGWFHRVSLDINDDEIGQLKNSYNAMLIEINQLIEELIQKEKNLQKAELDALQEQIKPHFLYNTLDTIRYLAIENETDKVNCMLESLGNFYRRFLSKGSVDIPLAEEIDIVKDYLTLQKNRYEDVFEDEYEIEEGLSGIMVPRLILQPLVENSIYHGLRIKGEKGSIKISAYRKDDMLHIKIYDSGIGMSEEQIKRLFDGTDSKSFGFKGTMERIRYYYRVDDVFEIHSIEGEFCEVWLKLPLEERVQYV